MREYYVDTQPWRRWPKALIMHHNWYPNGHAHKHEVKRYIPADEFLAENDKIAKAYEECIAENAKLRELVALMYRDMQGVLDMSTDTVWVDDVGTLRDEMDCHMQAMAELGMPPADYERRIHELGVEVE